MKVLAGQGDEVKVAKHCPLCLEDPNISAEMKSKLHMPAAMRKHLAADTHSPKAKWLRQFSGKENKCPFADTCTTCTFIGRVSDILGHVQKGKTQSDDHLLAAARAGLFARDFDPSEGRVGTSQVKKVGSEMKRVTDEDLSEVPLNFLVHPRNLTATGDFDPAISSAKKVNKVFRFPTKAPLTETAYWHTIPEDIYGSEVDIQQEQPRWIMSKIDEDLRAFGVAQADKTGATATAAGRGAGKSSTSKTSGLAALRQRLTELNFAWSADDDSNWQPNDGPEVGGEDEDGEGREEGAALEA